MDRLRATLLLALALSATGCELFTRPVVCSAELRFAIVADVSDSVGAGVVVGARVIAADGAYADTSNTAGTQTLHGLAGERAGTYTLTVTASGYQTWTRSGIVVTRDECHVQTVSVTVRLQR